VAVSPSSSVQRARQELAERLRDMRLDAGLSGRELSKAAGWHEAKTSRIELAKQAPSDSDIRVWCEICRVPDQAVDLIAASRAADSMYQEWRRLHRTGMRRLQETRGTLYERTRQFKVYMSTVVPGFLQTPGYAQALIEESVLRYRIGGSDVMSAQLGHLLSCTVLPNLRIGIIPFAADARPMWTLEAFTVFDDTRVHVETLTAQVTVTAPGEVIVYPRAFDQLARLAVYGAQARVLITDAINAIG
jgi:transcriptional regulator with XRE-family HTH domain